MASPMRSTQFRTIVEPILNESFDGIYSQRADEWKEFMVSATGTPRNYHEEPVIHGFTAAPEIPDGESVSYVGGGVLYSAIYRYKQYGLAFALTKILVEDGDHIRLGTMFSRHLAQSMVETKETVCANHLNRAFNSSYKGGDNVELISSSHLAAPGASAGSNILTTAANLSQTSLEQMLIQIRNATDDAGKKIRLNPKKLIVAPDNQFQAEVLLKSVLRAGTANNDINPVKSMGLLSEGCAVISRLTSATAWFIQTDAPDGLKMMVRRSLTKGTEGDFDTDSMRYKVTERYGTGWTNWRTLYGTAGL
jgi:hypothetical protein